MEKKIKIKRLVWVIILVIILVLSAPVIYTASLNNAIYNDNVSAVKFLLVFPGNLNRTNVFLDYGGEIPLANACARGNPEIVKMLVEKGADVDSDNSWNPIMAACRSSSPQKFEVIKILVEAGVDLNFFDGLDTPLSAIFSIPKTATSEEREEAYSLQFEIVRYLVDNGASFDSVFDHSGQVLPKAAIVGNMQAVEYLVGSGIADINSAMYSDKTTALMGAVEYGHIDIVEYLLEQGADITKENSSGYTALTLARMTRDEDIVKLIEEYAEQQETGESQ